MKHYTLGFVFTPDYRHVLLVLKNRPAWQVGKLNGLGGKVEAGETPLAGMVRELTEESALVIPAEQWVASNTMESPGWRVEVFAAIWTGDVAAAQTMTGEGEINWHPTQPLPNHVIDNLRWLVPMAANKLQAVDELATATVQYRQ